MVGVFPMNRRQAVKIRKKIRAGLPVRGNTRERCYRFFPVLRMREVWLRIIQDTKLLCEKVGVFGDGSG